MLTMMVIQQKIKKRLAYLPVLCGSWLLVPAVEVMIACVSTDIVGGVCVPYGVYSSVAMEKAIAFLILFVGYILPLMLMIFCYSRVVHVLRTKVSNECKHLHYVLQGSGWIKT